MNRHIQTLFCDDIRHEVGGKYSYIGVYGERLIVSTFPTILPKLCLALKVVTPAATPFSQLSLEVLIDDQTLAHWSFDEAALAETCETVVQTDPHEISGELAQIVSAAFVFSPLHLEGSGFLRVRAETESGTLDGLTLHVEQGEQ